MSVLRNLEQRIENLVEGVCSAVPSPRSNRSRSRASWPRRWTPTAPPRSRVYVPNQYTVWLSGEDPQRGLEGYERSLEQELSAYLLEHARRHDYALLTWPDVHLESDERLRLGEFGIQTRLVAARPAGRNPRAGRAGPHDGLQRAAEAVEVPQAPGGPPGRDEGDRLARRSSVCARRGRQRSLGAHGV